MEHASRYAAALGPILVSGKELGPGSARRFAALVRDTVDCPRAAFLLCANCASCRMISVVPAAVAVPLALIYQI